MLDLLRLSSAVFGQAPEVTHVAPTTAAGGKWAAGPFEIDRRRNFAIISHPDAGKTTLTEKLLLYGGAIQEVCVCDELIWSCHVRETYRSTGVVFDDGSWCFARIGDGVGLLPFSVRFLWV